MPIKRVYRPLISLAAGICLAIFLGSPPTPAAGQLSASLLDDETEIRSIRFRYLDSETFSRSRLLGEIGLTQRGRFYSLSKTFAFLPLVPRPEPPLFDPLSLQMDVARLREFYRGEGFPEARIRYEVTLDQEENLLEVEFLITEGRPRTLASLVFVSPSGAPLEEELDTEIVADWREFLRGGDGLLGERLGENTRARIEGSPLRWLAERGYPFSTANSNLQGDSAGFQVRLTVRVDPGTKSRVGSVVVEGLSSVTDAVLLRELPFQEGDWYSASQVAEGRRRVFALGLFRVATAEVVPMPEPDSSVQVVYRLREARLRSVSGFTGYSNAGGLSFGGEWQHRNFGGDARSLSVSGTAETGALVIGNEVPDKYSRAAVSLRQPFLFVPGLSVVASPFWEYRDDYRDRSWEVGVDGTLVYQYAPLDAVSLRYRVSNRKVLDYPVGDMESSAGLGISRLEDLLEGSMVVSAFTLSATLGSLDDPANPRRGYLVQPSLEVTAPVGFPTNEYFKAEVWGSLYRPLGARVGFAGSLRAGRLFPFAGSIPSSGDDGLVEFIQLRDVNLTAGGPTDVRGWASGLLGPKVPDIKVRNDNVYSASRYLPLGGLARISAALELQFPFPGLGSGFAGHVFLDGGRVWTPDHRFLLPDDPYDQDKVYFSTGAGVGVGTPVGPVRVSLGYKLNPSPLDVRDPGAVQDWRLEGRSILEAILEAPVERWRRFQLHLTVGRVF